ncbi:hypothetical protein D3C73_1084620 [compost metagenome]
MEIASCIPFRINNVVQIGEAKFAIHDLVHIQRTDAAALASSDIINMLPEFIFQGSFNIPDTQIAHQPSGIPVGYVFKHILQTVVKHNGVFNFAHFRPHNPGLTQTHPILQL